MTATPTETVPPKLTPWERRTQRLQMCLDEADAALLAARHEYASDIAAADNRVFDIDHKINVCEAHRVDLHTAVAGCRRALEAARAAVAKHEQALVELNAKLLKNSTDASTLDIERTKEDAARNVKLDQPTRHLAALEHDRNRLAYRLEQHLARKPHTALFSGSKP